MAALPSNEPKGVPAVALLLTWFLPGAGHVYVGRMVTGILGFLVVEGLFVVGLLLTEGRALEFLDPELRSPFATALTPELGNLGGLVWQVRTYGFGGLEPAPWPPHMMLGTILTALSGILNVCLMVGAHLEASTPRSAPAPANGAPHPALLVFFAWLVPGLGHLLQGRRLRAMVVFGVLVGLFVAGTWLAEGSNLSRERHFYYWSGQFLAGLPAIATEILSGRPRVTGELPTGDVGLLYACMGGLLNVLAMLDVFGVAERRWRGEDGDAAAAARATEATA